MADGIDAHGLAVTQGGRLYVTEPKQKKVWLVEGQGKKRVVDTGIAEPTGIALTPDQSLLLVADAQGIFVYSFQIQADGSLAQKQPYFHLHLVEGDTGTAASAMVVDANGYLYVTTALGIQVCDQAGRVNGIVSRPRAGAPGPLVLRRSRARRALRRRGRHALSPQDAGPRRALVRGAPEAGCPAALSPLILRGTSGFFPAEVPCVRCFGSARSWPSPPRPQAQGAPDAFDIDGQARRWPEAATRATTRCCAAPT